MLICDYFEDCVTVSFVTCRLPMSIRDSNVSLSLCEVDYLTLDSGYLHSGLRAIYCLAYSHSWRYLISNRWH